MADVPPAPTPYKLLSRTYQSSVRWSPGYLDRITIDDIRYKQYQDKVQSSSPLLKSQSSPGEIKKMGDNFFFVHRNIPIQQQYSRTSLRRSDVRPWDDLVDRPLMGKKVRDKEVQRPYPQEHPHASHIPHYLMLPDPCPHPPNPITNPPLTPKTPLPADIDKQQATPPPLIRHSESRDADIMADGSGIVDKEKKVDEDEDETGATVGSRSVGVLAVSTDGLYPCNPPRKSYIARKAYDYGTRVEVLDLKSMGKTPEMEHLLWQMPKGSHKRCITYPTPSHHFSRQSTTPNYLQLPSTPFPHTPSSGDRYNNPQHLHDAVADFHHAMCRTTSYTDHFPAHSMPPSRGSIDRTLRSVSSFRPFTSESRGKYHFYSGGENRMSRPDTGHEALPKQSDKNDRNVATVEGGINNEGEHMNGCDEDEVIVVDDQEDCGKEGKPIKTRKKMTEKKDKGDSTLDDSCPGHPPHLNIDVVHGSSSLNSSSRKIPPASRLMTKLYNFPPLEEKALRFPAIITTPQHSAGPSQKMAYMRLGVSPPQSGGIGVLLTPPSIKVRRSYSQPSTSLPLPHRLSQDNSASQQQTVKRILSNAKIVKQFTKTLKQQSYVSPDMRSVTMKEGKKHEFGGYHAYNYH